ncbi:helix-turn-helix domain-containing protein [Thalassotalea sp. HSM 43]|uniref:AraC family transcriptional regulator n=1 Tax=Thalassotalea sp. HSM 43 TaxID=2552945 RepID=UPI001080E716|nr:AraC family transcriptional regulator [Thalassotalea sp. HSM 43]QBY03315.1 helix-turn-helix domain-containing protein [Thalassotalea sp. HSM 43]
MRILDYQHSVLRSYLHMLIQTLESTGDSFESIRQYLQIVDSQDLLAQCGRVKGTSFLGIYAMMANHPRRKYLELDLGKNYRPVTFNALGPLCFSSKTLKENVELLIENFSLISTGGKVSKTELDDGWLITAGSTHHKFSEHRLGLAGLVVLYAHIRFSLGNDFKFNRIYLTMGQPEADINARIKETFQTDIEYNAPYNGFKLTHGQLAIEQLGHDPQLFAVNSQLIDDYKQRFSRFELPTRIYGNIIELMKKGIFSKEAIARELGMSTRSLSQKIKQFGLNYRDISENARMTLAREYLANFDLKLVEVAEKLCFSENSNFTRSFKAHTGQTPREFRSQLKANDMN